MKELNFIAYPACILLAFFVIRGAQAQNMQEVQPGPVVLNNGIVLPLENLNPFQDSTLDSTTLGKSIEQKSNVELNQPKENRSEVRGPEVTERTSQTQMEMESELSFVPLTSPMKTPIYVWMDKNGTTHFTNLIKSVPLEFRDQAIKRAKELQKETQSTP
jgi:hypothetical protein